MLGKMIKGTAVTAVAAVGAVLGALNLFSKLFVERDVVLPKAIKAKLMRFKSDTAGDLAFYVDETGAGERPLVLIHSINAAASSFEMRPLFEHYRGRRPVYALDLPGFGFAERSDRRYSPALYVDAIVEFLREMVGAPADVVALSLGSEFAAMAALRAPELVNSLTLLSPSGMGQQRSLPGAGVYQVVSFPLWGRPLFDLLATRASINLFLGRNFVSDPPADFIDYAYMSSHQPGSAPCAALLCVGAVVYGGCVYGRVPAAHHAGPGHLRRGP
jgi:pimeloyl-ACP methyl ester carboxylesterase